MSGPLFLGLDVGTQGCKAIVYNAKENKVVSRGAYSYEILKSDVPGRAEQHPSLWIQVVNRVDYFCQLCRHNFSRSFHAPEYATHTGSFISQGGVAALNEALSSVDRKSVKALSISGQQHGFVPVDKSGEVCIWLLVFIDRHTGIVMPACCANRCATAVLSKFLPVQ